MEIRTKIGVGGKVIIPSSFRKNVHWNIGDDIILQIKDNDIIMTTADQALKKLQAKLKLHNTDKKSLVDDLIAMRREEAKNEQ